MRRQSPKPFNIWIALAACAGLVFGGGIAAWLLLKGAPLIIPIVVGAQSSEPPRTGRRRLQRVAETSSGLQIGKRRERTKRPVIKTRKAAVRAKVKRRA